MLKNRTTSFFTLFVLCCSGCLLSNKVQASSEDLTVRNRNSSVNNKLQLIKSRAVLSRAAASSVRYYTCSAGMYLPANAIKCSKCSGDRYYCPGGKFVKASYNQGLKICASSKVANSGHTACVTKTTTPSSTKTTCSAGQYLKAGQKTCSQCLENNYCKGGTYTFNSGSDQGITKCLSNTYSPKGSSVCIACEKGIMELSSSATAICKACPSGKVPNSAHSQCVQATVCSTPGTYFNGSSCKPADKGYYVPSGSTTQKPCTGNTYSDVTGATSCKACPKATALAASVDTSKGDNGYFYYSTDGIHSRLGTGNGSSGGGCYVYLKSNEKNGKHNEVNCLFSQKTNDYGTDTTSGGLCRTDNKTQCNSGYHLNTKNVASTGFYWANSYKDLENTCITSTSSKITCSAGQYLKAGQKTCSQCLENNSCKGGTYTAGSSDQGITKCLANTYSPKGSAICIACEKGIMELSSSATAICKACPSGKIPNSAHSQCVQSSISDKTSFLKVSQHDMLFGPSKNSDTPLAEQCWTKTDIITYKQCILGDIVSTSTNTTQNKSKIKKDIKVNTKLLKKS